MSSIPSLNKTLEDELRSYEFTFRSSSQYDLGTFTGRFVHLQRQTDPRNFFLSNSQLDQAKELVAKYKDQEENLPEGTPLRLAKQEYQSLLELKRYVKFKLLRAKTIVDSAVSKDTGETIPRMMRMCAFVPVNIPILFGMILAPPTLATTDSTMEIGIPHPPKHKQNQFRLIGMIYSLYDSRFSQRILCSCGIFGLYGSTAQTLIQTTCVENREVRRLNVLQNHRNITINNYNRFIFILVNALVASMAGGTASFLNTYFMRRSEMNSGIQFYSDEQLTNKLGSSKIQTAFSRVFLSISCLMTPALIFYAIDKVGRTPKHPLVKLSYETAIILFALMVNLPASIAMFPTTGSIPANEVEQISSERPYDLGEGARVFYFKGL